jgi:hypothetical protein
MSLPPVRPSHVQSTIEDIAGEIGMSIDEVSSTYDGMMQELQRNSPGMGEEANTGYALLLLRAKYLHLPPNQGVSYVPIGYSIRSLRTGERYGRLYCVVMEDKNPKLAVVLFMDELCQGLPQIVLGYKYSTKLVAYKASSDETAKYRADERSKFTDAEPVAPGLARWQVVLTLVRKLGVVEVTSLKDAGKALSKTKMTKSGKQIAVDTDLRLIHGVVVDSKSGATKTPGRDWALLRITDASLPAKETVDAEGEVLQPTFTVWLDSSMPAVEKEAEVFCLGTIQVNKTKMLPQMNAISVITIRTRTGVAI